MSQKASLLITALKVSGLPLVKGKPPKKTWIKIETGDVSKTTDVFKASSRSPNWNTQIFLNEVDLSTQIRISLHSRRFRFFDQSLATVDIPVAELLSNSTEISLPFNVRYFGDAGRLVVTCDHNTKTAAKNLIVSAPAIAPGFGATDVPGSDFILSDTISNFDSIASLQPFKDLFDRLAQIHPLAGAAWGLLTIGYEVVQMQADKDTGIVDLHKAMIHTFQIADEQDAVKEWDILQPTFDSMIRQIIECQIFISSYISKSYASRLVKLDIAQKTAEFLQAFIRLEAEFNAKLARGVALVSIGTHTLVESMTQYLILEKLKSHSQQPRPRLPCLAGTRVKPITDIILWVLESNAELMYLTGLPGSGKSTLMSSIADATRKMGKQGRLGAFIRFDRQTMNDASNIVTTLAYKLAEFDARIAEAISPVIRRSPHFKDWPLESQFKDLIIEPLKAIIELREEGPIVVLVDALDECQVSEARSELLKVLAAGFGPALPFMRLIVSSRPLPDMTGLFNPEKKSYIRPYTLQLEFKSTQNDIRLYFQESFRQLEDEAFHELCVSCDAVEELTERACGLFIWASTTFEFIKQSPSSRLLDILKTSKPTEAEVALDSMYQIALTSALDGPGQNNDIKADMHRILGAILVSEYPPGLLPSAIDGLLFHNAIPKSQHILQKLACVIVSDNLDNSLQFLHKSFDDFLTEKSRSGDDWYIDIRQHEKEIAVSCLGYFTLCFKSKTNQLITSSGNDSTSGALFYACKYWISHICRSNPNDEELDSCIGHFFRNHFLRWLESMILLKLCDEIIPLLQDFLQYSNKGSCPADDRKLRYHGYQFAERFIEDIHHDTSSVFTTALSFSPENDMICCLYPRPGPIPSITHMTCNRLLALGACETGLVSLNFSPDGSKTISGSSDGTIRIWDATTGASLPGLFRGHTRVVSSIRYSKDGSKVVSGSYDNTIIIWDAIKGIPLFQPLRGHNGTVYAVGFSPDDLKVVSSSLDCTIQIWDVATGLPVLDPILGHEASVGCVAFSPDGTRLVSGADDCTVRMWDAATGAPLLEPMRHDREVVSVAFSPDGSRIVSGSVDSTIRIWNSSTGMPLLEPIRGHDDVVTCITFSNDGLMILSASEDNTIRVWDAVTGIQLLEPIQGHTDDVICAEFSPDGSRIASASEDSTIRIWDIADISLLKPLTVPLSPERHIAQVWQVSTKQLPYALENQSYSECVDFSPNGEKFITGGFDKTVRLWDASTGTLMLEPMNGHTDRVTAVAFSPNGSTIASGSEDTTIQLWDVATCNIARQPMRGHEDTILTVHFSPDGARLVSTSEDNTVRVWDILTGKQLFRIIIEDGSQCLRPASFSPGGTIIASGSQDFTVRLWDASTGDAIYSPLRGHDATISDFDWLANSTVLASASVDGVISLWDAAKGVLIRKFHASNWASLSCIKFSSDGKKLISSSYDGLIQVWNPLTGELFFEPIQAHKMAVTSVAVSGYKILSASFDRTLRIWDASTGLPLLIPETNTCVSEPLLRTAIRSFTHHLKNNVEHILCHPPSCIYTK